MAIIAMDSFDGYTVATQRWIVAAGSATLGSGGRFGNGMTISQTTSNTDCRKQLPSSPSTLFVSAAFRHDDVNRGTVVAGTHVLVGFYEGATLHMSVYIDTSGKLAVARSTTLLAVSTTPSNPVDTLWHHIQVKVVISDTVGEIVVIMDGVTEISLSGIDTRNAGAGVISQVRLGACGATGTGARCHSWWDDFAVADSSGSVNNTYLGDIRVEAIFPNGNGNSSVLVGSDGNSTDNYALVDETGSPDTADYVESSTVGDKDTYAFTDLVASNGSVLAVQVLPYAQKTDAGSRSIASVARLSGTEADSANVSLTNSWQYLGDIRETKPGGGSWTISDVNSAEFGVKVTA